MNDKGRTMDGHWVTDHEMWNTEHQSKITQIAGGD